MASSKLEELNARIAELSAQAQAALKAERRGRAQQLQESRRARQHTRNANLADTERQAPDSALQRRIQELTAKAYEHMKASRRALAIQRLQERQEKRQANKQAILEAERAHAHAVEATELARIHLEATKKAAEVQHQNANARHIRQSLLQEEQARLAEVLRKQKGRRVPRAPLKNGILEVRTAMARHLITVEQLMDGVPAEVVAGIRAIMTQFDIKIADILPSLRYTLAELQEP